MSFTQFICKSEPFCKCIGEPNEFDECCCLPAGLLSVTSTLTTTICLNCRETMCEIDFDTGEPVGP